MTGCNRLCLLVTFWTLVAMSVCYDVTTIYRFERTEVTANGIGIDYVTFNRLRGSVEIHARTDALGLPFMSPNQSVINPEIGVDVPPCTALHKGCDWKLDSWYIENGICNGHSSIPRAPLKLKSTDFNGCVRDVIEVNDMRESRPLESSGKLLFSFQPNSDESSPLVLRLFESSREDLSIYYYITIGPSRSYSYLFKCKPAGERGDYQVFYGSSNEEFCTELEKVDMREIFDYWRDTEWYNFTLEINDNQLDMSMDFNGHHDLFHWKEAEPILVKYYRFDIRSGDGGKFSLPDGEPVLLLSAKLGTLTSPVFLPTSDQVCFVVTFFLSPGTENTLQVRVQSASQKVISVPFAARETRRKWRTQRFVTDIPVEDRQKPIQVFVTATKSESSEVLIQRIFGCDAEGDEDVAVLSTDGPLPTDYTVYSVAVNEPREPGVLDIPWLPYLDSPLQCENGGVSDLQNAKCSCPVGFTGRLCAVGCGPNRYGDDCGGICSKSVTGCRGMLLCRPGTTCSCAPGIRGPNCDKSCSAGYYGAGCSQICGPCIGSGPCDPYMGTCVGGCKAGYFPPLCKNILPRAHMVLTTTL